MHPGIALRHRLVQDIGFLGSTEDKDLTAALPFTHPNTTPSSALPSHFVTSMLYRTRKNEETYVVSRDLRRGCENVST